MATYFDVEPLSLSGLDDNDHPFDFNSDDAARGETTEAFKSLFGNGGDELDKMFLDQPDHSTSTQFDAMMCVETGQQQEQPRQLTPGTTFKAKVNFGDRSRGHRKMNGSKTGNPRRRTSEPAPAPLDQ